MRPTVYLISLDMPGHHNLAIPVLRAYITGDARLKAAVNLRHLAFSLPVDAFALFNRLMRLEPGIIGFSCYMWNIEPILETCAMLKTVNPQITLILGGPEVGPRAKEMLTGDWGINYVIPGEGEYALKELLKHLISSAIPVEEVPGVCFLRDRQIISTPPVVLPLEQIPSPYKMGLIPFNNGYQINNGYQSLAKKTSFGCNTDGFTDAGAPSLMGWGGRPPGISYYYIEGSRGCPYNCGYCISGQQKPRGYSVQRVLADLCEIFPRRLPAIQFVDPCFNYDADRARDILRGILEYNKCTDVHVALKGEAIDEDTIALLKMLKDKPYGLVLDIGIQAVHPGTLRNISRSWAREKLTGILHELCKIPNCLVSLSLVIGLPGDTYESYKDSLDFVHRFDFAFLRAIICRLIPGCNLRQHAQRFGIRFNPHPPYEMISNHTFSYFEIQKANKLTMAIREWDDLRRLYRFFLEVFQVKASRLFEELEKWQHRQNVHAPRNHKTRFRILLEYARKTFKNDLYQPLPGVFFEFAKYFYFHCLHPYKGREARIKDSPQELDFDRHYVLAGTSAAVFFKYELEDLLEVDSGGRPANLLCPKPNSRLFFDNGNQSIRVSGSQRSLLRRFKQPAGIVEVFSEKNQALEKKELAFLKFCIEQAILIPGTK